MTTSHSPLSKLKAQAVGMAVQLTGAARGHDPTGKFADALTKPEIVVGIVMDDKVIKMEIAWATIRECGEVALSEMILKYMRGQRDSA